MRDYDPWVFTLMAEADHKEALRHVARAQLAHQALSSRAARPSEVSARRWESRLQRVVSGFSGYSRLLFRRLVTKAP